MLLALAALPGCKTRLIDLEAPDAVAALDLAPPPDLAGADLARRANGCADGTREGFIDEERWPDIAGCSGGFRIPGVLSATLAPACERGGGNDGPDPFGFACDVEDLCAAGWHVCASAADVAAHSSTGCVGAAPGPDLFFVTRQSSNGCGVCATGLDRRSPPCDGMSCAHGCAQTDATSNDIFGCGSLGDTPASDCGVLDRFGNNTCVALGADWPCGSDGFAEAKNAVHVAPGSGGAACCRD
jgi:hypothetical protein